MEKSFFFNAVMEGGVADRVYSAADLAEREAYIISDGVIGSTSLTVTGHSSNYVSLSKGAASIRGYTYINTEGRSIIIEAGDAEYDRIDTVALRLDLSERKITAVVVKGEPALYPVPAAMADGTYIKEMPLAEVLVKADSTPVVLSSHVTDRRVLAGYANLKGDLAKIAREFIGDLDPMNDSEITALRRLLKIIATDKGEDTVLCGDGVYRDIPMAQREVAAEFTVPGTYTVDLAEFPSADGIYDIEIQGGGGGGGCYDGITKRGGGGGGGAYLYVKGVTIPKETVTVTVGSGGIGGLGTDGGDGGDSSFDGFTAEGGRGGKASAAGGDGGVAMYRGGKGYDGDPMDGTELYPQCGKGGASRYGDGAAAPMDRVAANGNDAESLGAGGSGASCVAGAYDKRGGRGGDGTVVLYRYLKSVNG